MKKYLLSAVVSVLCCMHGQFASSQTYDSFHLIKYLPPPKWTLTQYQGSKQYMFSDPTKNDYCIITVYAAANSKGNISTDYLEEWKSKIQTIATDAGNSQPQYAFDSIYPNYAIGSKLVSLKNNTGSLFVEMLVLRMESNQRQAISFAMPTQNSFGKYSDAITSFINSIDNSDMKSDIDNNSTLTQNNMNTVPVNQNLGSNNGTLYVGMQAGTGGFDYGNSKRYLYLSPDNSFRYGYCKEGYFSYNTQLDRTKSPDFAGNYTTNGNNITLNFYSGRTMQFTVNSNKDLDGAGYRLTRFPSLNGHTIEGVYSQPNQRADVNGKVRMAALHKNGRFEDDGLLLIGNLIDPSLPYPVWQQKTIENGTPGNGSYVIVDNSLLLSYDDGRRIQLMIYISLEEINNPSPKLVVVAGESFTRVK